MVDVIPLKYGPIFKRAFSKPAIFRDFVEAVTGVQVNPSQIYTEYQYPERIGNVDIQYDVFAEDDKQRIIVEIQHVKEEDFFARFLYYHILGIIQQVGSFEEYEPPKTVYTIVVLTSVPRDGSIKFSLATHLMEILDELGERHLIAPHRLIFVNPRLVNKKTPAAVRPWMDVIEDSLDGKIDENDYQSPRLKELINEIQKSTMSAEESTAIKDESAWEKAKNRFREEGREEGREDGLEDGRKEGRRKQQEETAKLMLKEGLAPDVISRTTGLTDEEIQLLT
ncbi:MAG: Rpn family recombination-promoting nuclease/putative transposase [Chloroflexota bacterium]